MKLHTCRTETVEFRERGAQVLGGMSLNLELFAAGRVRDIAEWSREALRARAPGPAEELDVYAAAVGVERWMVAVGGARTEIQSACQPVSLRRSLLPGVCQRCPAHRRGADSGVSEAGSYGLPEHLAARRAPRTGLRPFAGDTERSTAPAPVAETGPLPNPGSRIDGVVTPAGQRGRMLGEEG